jgi:pimeloyl-ACP methyl ester carboxylesterase
VTATIVSGSSGWGGYFSCMQLRQHEVVRESGAGIRQMRWRRLTALMLGAAIVLVAVAWPFLKAHLQAVAVLRRVSGQPVPWIVRKTVAESIRVEEVELQTEAGPVRGRLYVPERHSNAPGLVVLYGVHHLGMDEPRLVSFATAMASCGLRVFTPQLPGIADYHVDRNSVQVIGDSARWFAGRTGGPVGVLGLSFSGGLALVAADEPVYQPDFKFVFAVGSQDAMNHVANYYLTGQELRPDGTVERLKPHEYGPLVLEYEHLEDFVPAEDESRIRPVLREHLYENKSAEMLAESMLNDRQKAEVVELMDSGSAATKAKLAASDAKHAAEMKELSPEGKLQTITTPVYLLHGEADNIIPAAETLWMAKELPRKTLQAELVSPVLSHLDLDEAKPGIFDQWRLVHFFALVLHSAERK